MASTPVPKPAKEKVKTQATPAARPPPPRQASGLSTLLSGRILPALTVLTLATSYMTYITPRSFPIRSADGEHELLASGVGSSGVVTVGHNWKENYRYLRAGHSLLGGLWTGSKAHPPSDKSPKSTLAPINIGDSIYSAFVLQEGILLFERTFPEDEDWTAKQNKALVMYVPS